MFFVILYQNSSSFSLMLNYLNSVQEILKNLSSIYFFPLAPDGRQISWTPKILQCKKEQNFSRYPNRPREGTFQWRFEYLRPYKIEMSNLPYLLADKSLFAWSTYRLYGSTNVNSPELIVWSACLMLIQSRFADTDDRVDRGLTDTTQVASDTIFLSVTECTWMKTI